jgi:hypothetical protein
MMQRMWLALRAGIGFRGARDYYEVFGYRRVLQPQDLLAKYFRQDIAKRVCDQPPEAIWAYPPEITNKAVGKLWKDLQNKNILPALLQADKLLNFDAFSILWLGLPGDPMSPAPKMKSIDDIMYISAHGAGSVIVNKYDDDPKSERFGLPVLYNVKIERAGITTTSALGKQVHWSRLVHLCDTPLQGRAFSQPRLEVVNNILDDILKVAGGSAETFWLASNRGMQVDVDKDMQFDQGSAKALSDEVDEYQHQLRRVLKTRGVKVTNLGSDIADPSSTFTTLIGLLSGATNIPQRVLLGAEAGQLASQQDRANWSEFVDRRRKVYAEPYALLPLFTRFIDLGLLNPGDTDNLEYEWPPAFRQNPLEDSQTMSAQARAMINLSRQSQYGTPYVGFKEGRVMMGLPPDLPADDFLPMPAAVPSTKKGGNAATGGAGGNDGSGDSGGGAQETTTIPVSDGTADPTSN